MNFFKQSVKWNCAPAVTSHDVCPAVNAEGVLLKIRIRRGTVRKLIALRGLQAGGLAGWLIRQRQRRPLCLCLRGWARLDALRARLRGLRAGLLGRLDDALGAGGWAAVAAGAVGDVAGGEAHHSGVLGVSVGVTIPVVEDDVKNSSVADNRVDGCR